MRARRSGMLVAAVPLTLAAALTGAGPIRAQVPQVLLVGSFNGIAGDFTSIQAAVDAAGSGDWILVGPGDYHEQGHPSDLQHVAGVLITTPGIHLRGMDRNHTVVDGTLPSAPNPDGFGCDKSASSQQLDAPLSNGAYAGRNGVEVFKADGVSVENLTVCNYLSSAGGENGNQVWFNGGDGSGQIGMHALSGAYLTASSSFDYSLGGTQTSATVPMGQYGIFTSNEGGPGVIAHTYASNMGDSSYYIGACSDCNIDLTDAHAENSALGFSGTNAGGRLVIENSEWDQNKTGIAPNALNNDDWPSPPNGACPTSVGTGSCSIIRNNNVHDNNNGSAPSFGIAGAVPTGTGVLLTGVENYTVTGNNIHDNSSWGLVVNDFPDTETPPAAAVAAGKACAGGTDLSTPLQPLCYYNAFGNEVAANSFSNNGSAGNPGDGDIAVATQVHSPGNCFHDNTDGGGQPSSDPPAVQTVMGQPCGQTNGWLGPSLASLVCGTPGAVAFGPITPSCPPPLGPGPISVTILPIPHSEATMPNPCVGVPNNPWCTNGAPVTSGANRGRHLVPAAVAGATVGLPDTAAAGRGTGTALAVGGLGWLVALGLRRRRSTAAA